MADPDPVEPNAGGHASDPASGDMRHATWWQRRGVMVLLAGLATVPLWWPALPPLSDLPGHIGRWRIMADALAGTGGPLASHYAVVWRPVGNLGADAIVLLLAPALGLEPAAKLVVLAIPALTVAALLWLAREAHGRVPGSALFALPLAYAAPFQLGFVNFALATAGVFAGLALWLRLARTRSDRARAAAFVPLAGLLWLCHAFGWALLGLFAFGAEWALRRARGEPPVRAAVRAALLCAPMALPVALLLVAGGAAPAGATGGWLDLPAKAFWVVALLRERWFGWDAASLGVLVMVLVFAVRSPRLGFAPVLGVPALLGAAAFVLLPVYHSGASLVDARVLPAALALGLLAIRSNAAELEQRLALAGAGLFAARLAGTTAAFALYAAGWAPLERAIQRLPVGTTVLVLVDEPAADAWTNPRYSHIAGLAVARRRVFTNSLWAVPGQQLIRPLHAQAAPFDRDPSQLVHPDTVAGATRLDDALARFDRGSFRYVWAIGFAPGRTDRPGLAPVWRDAASTLYRVRRPPPDRPASG